MLQQELGDLEVAAVDGRVERVAVRCDAFLGQVRIGAAFEQQPDDLDVPAGGGVLQRRAGAEDVVGDAVGERGSWSRRSRTRSRSPVLAAVQMSQ